MKISFDKSLKLEEYFLNFNLTNKINIVGPQLFSTDILEEPIVFIDGGTKNRKMKEGISVGDGDSFKGVLDIQLSTEKNYSDLSYVLAHIPKRSTQISLYGFLGGRKDHELINLGEVYHFLSSCSELTKVNFENQILAFSKGSWIFNHTGTFTVVTFSVSNITIQGACKYRYSGELSSISSHGLSNIAYGEVSFTSNTPFFLFF